MPTRFAIRFSDELIAMVGQLLGEENLDIGDDKLYLLAEIDDSANLPEFHAKVMTEDQILEEYKKDSSLHVLF